jgi:hypothetical protein
MNRRRPSRPKAAALAALFVLSIGAATSATGCSISAEQQPRPITRETTVPTTVDGN